MMWKTMWKTFLKLPLDIHRSIEKEERQVKKGNQFGRSSIRGLANLGFTIGTRIALATGLRRGEVFGLTWKNVNLRQNTIMSNKALGGTEIGQEG